MKLPGIRSRGQLRLAFIAAAPCFAVLTCGAVATVAQPAHLASAQVTSLAARDAANLAAIIRHDAHLSGSSAPSGTKIQTGCCGVRVLTVWYRSRLGPHARHGAYLFQLVSHRGVIDKIVLAEGSSHGAFQYPKSALTDELYSFAIVREGADSGRLHWGIVLKHPNRADDRYTTGTVAFHYEEAELTAASLAQLYQQALSVVRKGERREPVTTEPYLHPGLPCGLPQNQACEPGGPW
jgi:hypothetical protein